MAFIGVKMSNEDRRKLEELAEQNSMTVSGMIRELIRFGYEKNAVITVLQEIRAAAGNLSVQKGENGNNDTAEIKRIVTLIAKAMPSVAKHV